MALINSSTPVLGGLRTLWQQATHIFDRQPTPGQVIKAALTPSPNSPAVQVKDAYEGAKKQLHALGIDLP